MATTETELFWREFCRVHGVPTDSRHDVFAFGDARALQDELIELVLHGPKRATAALVLEFEAAGDPRPIAGGHSIVLDGGGKPRCIIRTTSVEVKPFGAVDAAFAWDEGEGDRTLVSWRHNHRHYFVRACAKLGHTFGEDMLVVLERFELVWVPPAS